MAKLYIANCTKQAHEFAFRVPAEDNFGRQPRLATIRIDPGTQQQIMGDEPMVVLQAIVNQHRQYGLVSADEVVRTKEFVGRCYSFDKPVDLDKLNYAFDHNQGVLFERGQQQRSEMAVAVDQMLRDPQLPQQPLGEVGVEVLEDADTPTMGERLRVVHAAAGGRR